MILRCEQFSIFWLLILAIAVFLFASAAIAAAPNDLNNPISSFTGLLELVQTSAASWDGKLREYANTLFWLLAAIQLVWTFFPLVFRQADFGEIMAELIRFIMVIGFFYALLLFSADWAGVIINSFRQAGATAAGLNSTILKPGSMFGLAVDLANTVGNVETFNPLTAFMITLSAMVVLFCFAFIAAFMGITIIESYIVINASVLFMGFGGSQWTRDYALAIVRYAVSVGAKLFVLTLIVGLIIDSAKQWAAAYNANPDDVSMWTMVGLSLTCAYLAKTIPELVAGMISGSSMGGGATLGGMAAAGLAGAAAAISTMTTTPAAAGVFGSTGSNSGVNDLATSINSGLAGGDSIRTAGLGERMSGSSSSEAARFAGSMIGGSASASTSPPAPQPSTTQKNNNTSNGISGHQVASAVTRSVGLLSALSVPGMDGAAGLTLGAGAPQPSLGTNSDNTDKTESKDAQPQNIIRPA